MARDAAIDALYKDYLETSKSMPAPMGTGCGCTIMVIIWVAIVGLWLSKFDEFDMLYYGAAIIAVVAVAILSIVKGRPLVAAVEAMEKEKPGFKEFHAAYLKHQSSEDRTSILRKVLLAGPAMKRIDS